MIHPSHRVPSPTNAAVTFNTHRSVTVDGSAACTRAHTIAPATAASATRAPLAQDGDSVLLRGTPSPR